MPWRKFFSSKIAKPITLNVLSYPLYQKAEQTGQQIQTPYILISMIGKTILELDRVDSTNGYANRLFSGEGLEEGTVIWAHEQYAGRGQQFHQWISEPGRNLTFTVVLKPGFLKPDQQFQLNKAVSLAVLDFIRNSLADSATPISTQEISIKWPNDIYIGNEKVGGILIEHKIMGISIESSLAGIGININQAQFSSELPNPVSLIQILGTEINLKSALANICKRLDVRYKTLRTKGSGLLDRDYSGALLGFGQWRNFTCNGEILEGKVGGVDDLGRLLMEIRNGKVMCFNHGEVEYLLEK